MHRELILSCGATFIFLMNYRILNPIPPMVMTGCAIFAAMLVLADYCRYYSELPPSESRVWNGMIRISNVGFLLTIYLSFPVAVFLPLFINGNEQSVADIFTLFALGLTLILISLRQ